MVGIEFPALINNATPIILTISPVSWMVVSLFLKNRLPNKIVKTGVKLFNIPVYPEERPFWAYVKKNDGRKLPKKPTPKMEKKTLIFFILFK